MFLGKLRRRIEEIHHKYPKLDVEIMMAGHEYFSVHICDGDNFLYGKRVLSASDLDSYAGDAEDLLIIVLNQLVREIENAWKTYCGIHYDESALAKIGSAVVDDTINEQRNE